MKQPTACMPRARSAQRKGRHALPGFPTPRVPSVEGTGCNTGKPARRLQPKNEKVGRRKTAKHAQRGVGFERWLLSPRRPTRSQK
jgi:hypothetical protein